MIRLRRLNPSIVRPSEFFCGNLGSYYYRLRPYTCQKLVLFAIAIRLPFFAGDLGDASEIARASFKLLNSSEVAYFAKISRLLQKFATKFRPKEIFFALDLHPSGLLSSTVLKYLCEKRRRLMRVLPVSFARLNFERSQGVTNIQPERHLCLILQRRSKYSCFAER